MAEEKRCGTCVMRNGFDTDAYPKGFCTVKGQMRHRMDPPMSATCWFGKTELRKPNYGAAPPSPPKEIPIEDLY